MSKMLMVRSTVITPGGASLRIDPGPPSSASPHRIGLLNGVEFLLFADPRFHVWPMEIPTHDD